MTDMPWKKKTVASPNLTFKKICHDALTSAETLAAADGFDLKKKNPWQQWGGKFQWAIALVSGETLAYRGSNASSEATHI